MIKFDGIRSTAGGIREEEYGKQYVNITKLA
jgi:hypothetical protein